MTIKTLITTLSPEEAAQFLLPDPTPKLPIFNSQRVDEQRINHAETLCHAAMFRKAPVIGGTAELLSRFAVLVSALTESEHAVFLVYSSTRTTQPDIVHAVVTPPGNISKSQVQFVSITPEAPDSENAGHFDFAVRLGDWAEEDSCKEGAMILDVNSIGNHSVGMASLASLRLKLRYTHGPLTAAKHLLRLTASYLAPTQIDQSATAKSTGIKIPRPAVFSSILPPQAPKTDVQIKQHDFDGGFSPVGCLHDAFARRVASQPDAVAVDYLVSFDENSPATMSRQYTYREIDVRANELANEITLLAGCSSMASKWKPVQGSQRAVPLFLPSGPEMVIGILGVLRAGHAFCPLPMDAPMERRHAILEDAQAPVVIGAGSCPFSPEEKKAIFWVDMMDLKGWRAEHVAHNISPELENMVKRQSRQPHLTGESVAYILYTSGSTGKPKGVLMSHRAPLRGVAEFANRHAKELLAPDLRWFVMCIPSFDSFQIELWTALGLGGTLCIADRNLMLTDTERCVRLLRGTACFAVPSLAMLLRPDRMPTFRTMVCGGELMLQRVIDTFVARPGSKAGASLINVYGPTEAGILITSETFDANSRNTYIGELFPQATAYIIDADSQEPHEVALGLSGELALGGPQVGMGYLNRPEETARGFVQTEKWGMIYRTGDKVRVAWTPDGRPAMISMGRLSTDQVKVKGRRIELPEIEMVLTTKMDNILEASVVVCQKTKLVACISPRSLLRDIDEFERQCRAKAAKYLPGYMQPDNYFIMAPLTRSLNGKVDRKAIAAQAEQLLLDFEADLMDKKSDLAAESEFDSGYESMESPSPSPSDSFSSDILAIVRLSLVTAIGPSTSQLDSATPLSKLGLDSMKAMIFLRTARDHGIDQLAMKDVLRPGATMDDIVSLLMVEERQTEAKPCAVRAPSDDTIEVEELSEDELFSNQVPVAKRLRHFERQCRTTCMQTLGIADPAEICEVLPTMASQNHMLNLFNKYMKNGNRSLAKPFVEHFVYEVPASINPPRFQNAVDEVLQHHDCFRTVFTEVEHPLAPYAQCVLAKGSPRAVVPACELVVSEFNNDEEDSMWHLMVENAQRSAEAYIRLDRPGSVVSWVRTPHYKRVSMVLSLFHPIEDGFSLALLIADIMTVYNGGKLSSSNSAETSMRKAVEIRMSTDWFDTIMFWLTRVDPSFKFKMGSRCPTPLALNDNKPKQVPGRLDINMEFQSILSKLSLDELAQVAKTRLDTTLLSVIQAAWITVLAKTRLHNGSGDNGDEEEAGNLTIEFGNILHGRDTADALRCVAPMLSTVPMSVLLEDIYQQQQQQNPLTNRAMCQKLARQTEEVADHLNIPAPSHDLIESQEGRFDSILILQTTLPVDDDDNSGKSNHLPGFHWGGNRAESYQETNQGFPVCMEVWPGSNGKPMLLKCTYNTKAEGYEFLTNTWVMGMLEAFENAIGRIASEAEGVFSVLG